MLQMLMPVRSNKPIKTDPNSPEFYEYIKISTIHYTCTVLSGIVFEAMASHSPDLDFLHTRNLRVWTV